MAMVAAIIASATANLAGGGVDCILIIVVSRLDECLPLPIGDAPLLSLTRSP